MAVTTATFYGYVDGSYTGTTTSNGVFHAGNAEPFAGYLSDSQSTNGLINPGDKVTCYFSVGNDQSGIAGVFYGFYENGGTEYPLFEFGDAYRLLGQTQTTIYPISAQADSQVTCYGSGTLIRTVRGDLAVEHLAVGDLAVTASGAHRPIRWLGHRRVDCRTHPRPHEAMPVRIAAQAFGENRPARDLFVSPGHAICVDVLGEVLIPAIALVNGTTITQENVDAVTYWHVELDSHDILIAEGLPAESYLDMGNRGFFAESGIVALDASPDAPVPTHAAFCRPFHMDGSLVEAVRVQLAARAEALGWRLEAHEPGDLHLLVDGMRVDPQVRGFVARFPMPADARDVWLVAPTSSPATIGESPDLRMLGACLTGLDLDEGFGACRTIAVDDPRLCVGFHDAERDAATTWRWTAGHARLPASLWAEMEGDLFLRVKLAGPMLPRWVAPARIDAAAFRREPIAVGA